jgi:hypothetical protein
MPQDIRVVHELVLSRRSPESFVISLLEFLGMAHSVRYLDGRRVEWSTVFPNGYEYFQMRLYDFACLGIYDTSRPSGYNSCFVFGRSRVKSRLGDRLYWQVLSGGFPQSHQANAGIVPKISPRLLPSTCFPIYYSLAILSFDDYNMSYWQRR